MATAGLTVLRQFEDDFGSVVTSTMTMTTFGLLLLAMGLSARSEHRTLFDRHVISGGRRLRLFTLSLTFIVLGSELGVLQRGLATTSLTGGQWLVCAALGAALLLLDEMIKLMIRARRSVSRSATASEPGPAITWTG